MRPIRWIIAGGSMLLAGWMILVSIVAEAIPARIWLSMLPYALTLLGFYVGIVGVIMYVRTGQNR